MVYRCKIPWGMVGDKSDMFPEGIRALSEGNLVPISHYFTIQLINQQINELHHILVYSNAI